MGKDECAKKIRGCNYNLEEKNLLINLANKYKNVIENKKTDGISNAEKERIWKKIETEFNAIAPNNVFRNVSSLKKLYDNLKKNVRKEAANERISILKTGGGKPVSSASNPIKELTLETINHKTVYGLTNAYDSDNIVSSPSHINIDNENSWTLETSGAEEENVTSPHVLQEEHNNKQPTADASTSASTNNNATSWKSRRRPTAPAVALYSNDIAKYYTELGKEKLEIAKLEKEILKKKLLQDQKEHELRCQVLEADLEFKRQRLN